MVSPIQVCGNGAEPLVPVQKSLTGLLPFTLVSLEAESSLIATGHPVTPIGTNLSLRGTTWILRT